MAGPAGQDLLRVDGVGVRLGGRDISGIVGVFTVTRGQSFGRSPPTRSRTAPSPRCPRRAARAQLPAVRRGVRGQLRPAATDRGARHRQHRGDRAHLPAAADVRPDDRPGSRGAVVHKAAGASHRPGRRHRPGHRLGRHRGLLPHQLAARILRRCHRRQVLPARPGLGHRPQARVGATVGARAQSCPLIQNGRVAPRRAVPIPERAVACRQSPPPVRDKGVSS